MKIKGTLTVSDNLIPDYCYTEVSLYGKDTILETIFCYSFKLKKLEINDKIIIMPRFKTIEDIKCFTGFISREEDTVKISISEFERIKDFDFIIIKKDGEENA